MSSVDDRIVNMQFNNKQFTQGASESQRALEGLDKTIANTGKGSKGIDNLANSVQGTTGKFSAMKVAGITAVATIANKAVNAGLQLAKSLTLDPIMAGFNEYQTNLNSTQTIMANTGKNVNVVGRYLKELNTYSDKTIYNFSEMARNIGTFTAAGVDLKTSTASIKGIANLAALSGSNSQQASTAMYQLSQAIAGGKVGLQDWNSVVNAGMGGAAFQRALSMTAEKMGTLEKGSVKLVGSMRNVKINGDSFRMALTPKPGEKSWLTSDVLTKTLKQFTGDLSDAELAAQGFNKAEIAAIQKQAQAASKAATRIKTIPQLMQVVKESVGSGFAQVFQNIFGNFNQSAKLWTSVGKKITDTVANIFTGINAMLGGWRKMGGYDAMWEGFGNIFQALGNILKPLVTLFHALMPATGDAGAGLANASKGFRDVTYAIEVATRGVSALTPVFAKMGEGVRFVFGVLGDGLGIVKNFFGTLNNSLNVFGGFTGTFDHIGEAISSGIANGFDFTSLGNTLNEIGVRIVGAIKSFDFGSMSGKGEGLAKALTDGLKKGLDPSAMFKTIKDIATGIIDAFKIALGIHSPSEATKELGMNIIQGFVIGLGNGFKFLGKMIGKIASGVMDGFNTLFADFDAMDFAGIVNAVFAGGLLVTLNKGISSFKGFADVVKGSVLDTLTSTQKALKTYQQSLKAKMLMEIAIAVALLAASLAGLSMLDPKKLAIGLGAITVLLGTLSGTLLSMSKIESDMQMAVLATSFLIISSALINLAIAITILGQQDPAKIATGLAFLSGALGLMLGAVLALSKIKGSVEGMAGTIFVLALSMNVLASAVLAFGLMKPEVVAQGLATMAIGLGLLVGAMLALDTMKKSVEGVAGAIFIISSAMVVLSTAVLAFGMMDLGTLSQGMFFVALGLGMMVGALMLLSGNAEGVLAGAGAMIMMATAMNLMVGVILALGAAPWQVVAVGIGFVALALTVFLAAGAAAMVVAPGLYALGTTMLMLGAAMFLAGVGMAAFGTGFAILAATGTAGIAVIVAAIEAFFALLPAIAQQIAMALVAVIKVIANAMPKLRESFNKIFRNLIGIVIDNIPVIRRLLQTLINNGIKVLSDSVPKFIELGFRIIDEFLKSAEKHVPSITRTALSLVVKFMDELRKGIPKVADSGAKLVIGFINGIADAINNNVDDLRNAGLNLAGAIINGLTGGLGGRAVEMVKDAATAIADKLPGWMKKVLGINSPARKMIPIGEAVVHGVARGIAVSAGAAVASVTKLANAIISEGNTMILRAAQSYRRAQDTAYRLQAVADAKRDASERAAIASRQNKKSKVLKARAKAAKKAATAAQNAANKQQGVADRAQERINTVREFEESDNMGKGDIRSQQAVQVAERANKLLQRANAEAAEARKLMKTNKRAGELLLKQSRKDAAAARKAADDAQKLNAAADNFYRDGIKERIAKLEEDAAFEKADTAGKAEILKLRAETGETRAETLRKEAEALTNQAKAIADKDSAAAMKLLDQAEKAAQAADDAASSAESDRKAMEDLLKIQAPDGSGGSSSLTPSRSVLEDAASAVDRYTASLNMAQDLAEAQASVIQFVQNNHSPEALSASEIYRNSKNLLSFAEIKMGANR